MEARHWSLDEEEEEWNQCWEVVMEAGEWSLDEEEEEGVESMSGDGYSRERLVIGWEAEDGSRRVVLA
jgi:hypothetical protein